MKHVKKLLGLLLALTLSLTLCLPAFAASGVGGIGTITIDNAAKGQTYTVYRIMDLESYNTDIGAYAYRANSDWATWLQTKSEYIEFVDKDKNNQADLGYVKWKEGADVVAFAKEALAYAKANPDKIKPVAKKTSPVGDPTSDRVTVTFDNLPLGYYLVDTTLGTICSLNTMNPNVTMKEKNDVPKVEKEVQEDFDQSWGSENTAEIGDTVKYRTTVTIVPGAANYILHDVMDEGLTLDKNSIKINGLTAGKEYTVATTGLKDECAFEITFAKTYLDSITQETEIVVTYSAVVNENAKIYTDENNNKTWLEFGEKMTPDKTPDSTTKTYTFTFDIVKTDDENELITGAEFKLYDSKTGGNEIPLVADGANTYRLAKDGEAGEAIVVNKNHYITVNGLDDNTTYWLEETKTPEGYHKLTGRVEVALGEKQNISTTMTGTTWVEGNGGVHVVNKPGKALPSTGGMGTALFYIGGGVLVVGAAALFVLKKRKEDTGK